MVYYYYNKGNPTWDWYVEYKGMSWLVLLNTWIKQTSLPVLVVQYNNNNNFMIIMNREIC